MAQRLRLFFDPELQGAEDKELSREILECRKSLESYLENGIAVDDGILKRLGRYFSVSADENSVVTSYTHNQDKVDEKSSRNGYFAIVCVNIDKKEHDAAWILSAYRKRDM